MNQTYNNIFFWTAAWPFESMVGPGNLSLDLTLMGHVSKDESPDEILSLPCSFFHIVILYNHLTWLSKHWPFCSKFQQSLCYLCSYITCDCDPAFVSVCKGDVVLKDLKLKAEALNSLRLPVTVKAGFVGTITLKVHFFIVPYMIVSGFNFVVFFLTSQYQVVVY